MAAAGYTRDDLSFDLRRAGAGDRLAFERVYVRTSAKLFGICLHVAGEREAAEDILSDVYVTVWRKATLFDEARASPITWLSMIARNRAIDWKRSEGRRTAHADEFAAGALPSEDVPLDQQFEAAEIERETLRCLDTLNDDQRGAIRDAFLEGLTYSKLAERLRVPLATVKSRIRRGLAELKKCLGHG